MKCIHFFASRRFKMKMIKILTTSKANLIMATANYSHRILFVKLQKINHNIKNMGKIHRKLLLNYPRRDSLSSG